MFTSPTFNWLSIPIIPCGWWGSASLNDVAALLESVRSAVLTGLSLDATRIPSRIDVIGSQSELIPITFARDNPDGSATIRINAPDRLWAKLSYNFAHELGHVLAGSWRANAVPAGPSHWLEEAVVEAFAIFTLKKMADKWSTAPPYPNWSSYSDSLHSYASHRISELRDHPHHGAFVADGAAWFRNCHNEITSSLAVTTHIWPIIPWLVDQYLREEVLIADLVSLNRWPERAQLSLEEYLSRWECSATTLKLSGQLPSLLRHQLL